MTNLEKSLCKPGRRPNSVAVIGALFGDEGKGRITDNLATYFLKNFKDVIVYRDNGGANAGHTISVGNKKIGLHQIGSGILHKGCHVLLGKGMTIHPIDLLLEIEEIKKVFEFDELPSNLIIDEMAILTLDTHRAFEQVLKSHTNKKTGVNASTGRGIAPSYADVIYRFPIRVRDLIDTNWKTHFTSHYNMYKDWISGMGEDITNIEVSRFKQKNTVVGDEKTFIQNISDIRERILPYCMNIYDFLKEHWEGDTPFIFEKAQAIGLDYRWGMYPDVTASNCCLDGITYSTEGIVDANLISARIGVHKSTYTSSVGKRILPTQIKGDLVDKIRNDANEYGTTTGRPRDIAYMDLVMLKYFCKVSNIEELAFTHMDIVYDHPVKVCVSYTRDGKESYYRPDMKFLKDIRPIYKEFNSWKKKSLSNLKSLDSTDTNMKNYIEYLSKKTNTTPVILTYGPDREDIVEI